MWPVHILDTMGQGAEVLGTKSSVYAIGAIMGGLMIGKMTDQLGDMVSMNVLYAIYFLGAVAAIYTKDMVLFAIFQAFIGFGNASIKVLRNSMMMKIVPGHIYGRVNSIFFSLRFFLQTIFVLGLSLMVETVGTVVAYSAFLAIVLMGFFFIVSVKRQNLVQPATVL